MGSRRILIGVGALVLIIVLAVGAFIIFRGSGNNNGRDLQAGIAVEPLTVTARPPSTLLAGLTTADTGISFMNQLNPENFFKYTYNGAGVAAGDYDSDGLTDLFLVSEQGQSRLDRNLGGMRFEDATEQSGLTNNTAEGGFSL
jgi:hypothetical protein